MFSNQGSLCARDHRCPQLGSRRSRYAFWLKRRRLERSEDALGQVGNRRSDRLRTCWRRSSRQARKVQVLNLQGRRSSSVSRLAAIDKGAQKGVFVLPWPPFRRILCQ